MGGGRLDSICKHVGEKLVLDTCSDKFLNFVIVCKYRGRVCASAEKKIIQIGA